MVFGLFIVLRLLNLRAPNSIPSKFEFGELYRLATAQMPCYQCSTTSTPRDNDATVCHIEVCQNGRQRAWGNCSFPSVSLTRRSSGVRHVFVATFIKRTVLSAGYAGA